MCTVIKVSNEEKNIHIVARSMEFEVDTKSEIAFFPRDTNEITSEAPAKCEGVKWVTRYAYIGITAFGLGISDGINEKGLSAELLWFPENEYPPLDSKKKDNYLKADYLMNWILGQFDNVNDVVKHLQNVNVWDKERMVPGTNEFFLLPAHWSVHDAKGNSIVIEFFDRNKDASCPNILNKRTPGAKLHIFENNVKVMTNGPSFDWQVTNLKNYVNLNPVNLPTQELKNVKVTGTGQGTGLLGIPGDYTPPSRFIRVAELLNFSDAVTDSKAAHDSTLRVLNLAEHIMNNVDIIKGTIIEKEVIEKKNKAEEINLKETTQWVVFKDLCNKILYYRTYESMTLRKIDMKKFDVNKHYPSLELQKDPAIRDITDDFVKAQS